MAQKSEICSLNTSRVASASCAHVDVHRRSVGKTEPVELRLVDCRHQMLVADWRQPGRLARELRVEIARISTGFLQRSTAMVTTVPYSKRA